MRILRITATAHCACWGWRRTDQAVAAALVLCGLAAMAWYHARQGGLRGDLLEIERAPRRPAQYVVDINAAAWPELAQLPGVGEELARRIVQDREVNGPFVDRESLRRVRGIGPKTLDLIKPHLRPLAEATATAGR